MGALHFPPFYFVKSTSHVEGNLMDMITKILKRASIDYVVRGYPPKRLYKNVADGKTDIWVGNKEVPVYEGKIIHSDFPIFQVELRVYTIDDKELPSVKEELRAKNIITMRGYSYGGMIKFLEDPENKISTDPANSHKSALLKLKGGRADYLLDYKYPVSKELEKTKVKNLKYNTLFKIPLYIMVSKKTPKAEKILHRMEKAYHQLKKEGKIE
ncbi:transporter substrate-binding domain-containing protein [Desulfococcaceae bacterium HSG8]|nr:transporter substrate-binding domain-containing protein [Desulfococcaceae bacterium HSG8]